MYYRILGVHARSLKLQSLVFEAKSARNTFKRTRCIENSAELRSQQGTRIRFAPVEHCAEDWIRTLGDRRQYLAFRTERLRPLRLDV